MESSLLAGQNDQNRRRDARKRVRNPSENIPNVHLPYKSRFQIIRATVASTLFTIPIQVEQFIYQGEKK
jgi:hypothetical protein